ncbi:MAG: peptide chain release factor N(5)-glutamine methyltransferase [Candidatus Zipacnadales bacterium]
MRKQASPNGNASGTIRQALETTVATLTAAAIDSPRAEARLLLAHALGVPLTRLDVRLGERVPKEAQRRLREAIAQRLNRRPLAYITGETEFMGLRFRCDERALVPRSETEILVEVVASRLKQRDPQATILDIGTGTGAIGLSLAKLLPRSRVILTDLSGEALALARENAVALDLTERVRLLEGFLLDPVLSGGLAKEITCVVSNPPYVAPAEVPMLPAEVAQHEPPLAWRGEGPGGMGIHARLITDCARHLPNARLVALEIGLGQAAEVRDLCRKAWPSFAIFTINDLCDIERVIIAQAP